MKNINSLLLILLFAVIAGCSSGNSDAPLLGGDPAPHPTTWVSQHGAQANSDLRGCQGCHGFDYKGSGDAVSCFNCHSGGPPFVGHPASWNGNPLTGHQANFNGQLSDKTSWNSCANAACHGTDLQGTGTSGAPSCMNNAASCHATSTTGWPPAPHGNYSSPTVHGPAAKGQTDSNLSMGNYCAICHADANQPLASRFNGGFVAVNYGGVGNCSASSCHPTATAHPSNWASTRSGNSVYHNNGNITANPNIKSDSCALCHTTTAATPASPFTGAPTCFNAAFNGLNCHASGPGGAPHAIPFTDPNDHGPAAKADLAYCAGCHASGTAAGSNPSFNVAKGSMTNGCEDCHATGSAHATGIDRWTFNKDTTYPTRRTHFSAGLDGTNPRDLGGCSLCHNVTTADSGGTAPACTTCHLSLTATGPSAGVKCTYCHTEPPDGTADLTGGTAVNHLNILNVADVSQISLHDNCSLCHGASQNGSTGILVKKGTDYDLTLGNTSPSYQGGDHLDGNIELNVTGAGYSRTNTPAYSCTQTCHSTETGHVFTNSTLTLEAGDYGSGACNSCHNYPPDGNAWPDGSHASSTNHLSTGTNPRTGASLSDAQFYANHDVCATCHGVKGNQTPPTLATARTGAVDLSLSGGDKYLASYHNDTNIQMNGYDALIGDGTDDNNAGYDGTGGCTNACHPPATSYKLTPSGLNTVQKREFGGGCDACHSYPPTSGAHTTHVGGGATNKSYDCQECHTSPFDSTTHNQSNLNPGDPYDPTSATILANVNIKTALGGYGNIPAGGTFDSGTKICSNTYCHGFGTPKWNPASTVQCGNCHGIDTNGRPATPASGGGHFTAGHSTATNNCDYCHPHNGGVNAEHVNGPADTTNNLYAATVSTTGTANNKLNTHSYGGSTLGTESSTLLKYTASTCTSSCHGTATWGGSLTCAACHNDGGTSGAPQVNTNSSHVDADGAGSSYSAGTCEDCHPGGTKGGRHATNGDTGVIVVNNNTTVGINYTHLPDGTNAGFALGGNATTGTTEAEICWNCHDQNNDGDLNDAGDISEWGLNTDTNGVEPDYDFGTLNVKNWTTATWTSATGIFSYKTGAIQSTHAVNDSTGTGTTTRSGVDDVATIRCSYCHDVHDLNSLASDSSTGKPYLRGTWMGNPYPEDGAPHSTSSYTNSGSYLFGAVPRGNSGTPPRVTGGYFIDQNRTTSGGYLNSTTWALSNNAGLCMLCHTKDVNGNTVSVDSMNYYGTASTDWVGTNGHSNAVIGGSGANKANIFDLRGGNLANSTNPAMAFQGANQPGDSGNFGFRNGKGNSDNWAPLLNGAPAELKTYSNYAWGATVDAGTIDDSYHQFPCSKCHNPHASRLPRLMITNCLDTRHNTWDDSQGTRSLSQYGSNNSGQEKSNLTSAQNCHRVGDTGTGAGWNNVTPW